MLRDEWEAYLADTEDAPTARHGVCYVPELAIVEFRGADAIGFLQGYLTCDALQIVRDRLTPTAICNLQGRVLLNGWCRRAEELGIETVNLIIHRSLIDRLVQFLEPYLAFSKTATISRGNDALVFASNQSATFPAFVGPNGQPQLLEIFSLQQAREIWQASGQTSAQAWRNALIESGIPLVSLATSEAFLPQMLGLVALGAVDFEKGCYLGQEVVARAQHRGAVKRKLRRLRWEGVPPVAGDQFRGADDDRSTGTVVNSSPSGDSAGICVAVVADAAQGPWNHGQTRFFPLA